MNLLQYDKNQGEWEISSGNISNPKPNEPNGLFHVHKSGKYIATAKQNYKREIIFQCPFCNHRAPENIRNLAALMNPLVYYWLDNAFVEYKTIIKGTKPV